MKISQQNIDKIRDRINNLNECLNRINVTHPSNITCAMGATINSLSHILDEIDLDVKIETNNYLTYEDFQDKLIDSDVYHWYYFFQKERRSFDEDKKQFYNKHIEYINDVFVPKL